MPEPSPPSDDAFRDVVSRFATGITVVTCVDAAGLDHAMTASSFVSVSLDPLLVSVCVERGSKFHAALAETDAWAVSILKPQGQDAARWLATRGRPLAGQLDRTPHTRGAVTGAAVLEAASAHIECRTWASYDGGDHDIVVGEVLGLALADSEAEPLVYYRRGFRRLSDPGSAAPLT
ncbi:MAG: flavin reductase family protein [Actinomycetes bacterium]